MRICACTLLLLLTVGNWCEAQIAVDGTFVGDEADYGAARSVQNTNTGYGNSTNGDPKAATGGSEIDRVFATVRADRLYVLITGNLEANFNKLSVFIDSGPGGVNQIVGASLPALVDPYCCGGSNGALQALNGLRFDTTFAADHFLAFSNGNHTYGSPAITRWTLSAYYADLTQGAAGDKSEIGFQWNHSGVEPGLGIGEPIDQVNNGCTGPSDTNCMPPEHEFAEPIDTVNDPTNSRGHRDFLNEVDLLMAINNSNTQGVNAGSGAATGTPASVLTGIEFSLPLSVLGNPTADIKIAAFIGSGNYGNVSNQLAGVGVLRSNLGGPSSVNLANITGNQFVTLPVPSGDFDGDGDVDGRDFLVWQRNNGNATDLALWQEQYGAGGALAASFAVPEPTSSVLLVFLAVSMFTKLRR
ncbi:MAG: hypothetical protein SH868_11805 [Bythopirellula sp.]|nr:hypothetical protein [Bythopirellula sp.]